MVLILVDSEFSGLMFLSQSNLPRRREWALCLIGIPIQRCYLRPPALIAESGEGDRNRPQSIRCAGTTAGQASRAVRRA